MTIDDYEQVYKLWQHISGFGIRSIDDSKEGIQRFIKRNPKTSVVALKDRKIVGSILCGHDGRTGCFYHVCVDPDYRNHGIATQMTKFALEALRKEEICKVTLVAFSKNQIGNTVWHELGWKERTDLNYYEYLLNEQNRTVFNKVEE